MKHYFVTIAKIAKKFPSKTDFLPVIMIRRRMKLNKKSFLGAHFKCQGDFDSLTLIEIP